MVKAHEGFWKTFSEQLCRIARNGAQNITFLCQWLEHGKSRATVWVYLQIQRNGPNEGLSGKWKEAGPQQESELPTGDNLNCAHA